jgi:hypothetical protein
MPKLISYAAQGVTSAAKPARDTRAGRYERTLHTKSA